MNKVRWSHSVVFIVTPWTVAYQTLLSMEFSRQEYWNGLPCPPPGDLPDTGTESPALQADSLPFELAGKTYCLRKCYKFLTQCASNCLLFCFYLSLLSSWNLWSYMNVLINKIQKTFMGCISKVFFPECLN